jgi:hypothetical protein
MGRNKIRKDTAHMTLYIERDVMDWLAKASQKDKLSKNHIVEKALNEYITRVNNEKAAQREHLAISHAESLNG